MPITPDLSNRRHPDASASAPSAKGPSTPAITVGELPHRAEERVRHAVSEAQQSAVTSAVSPRRSISRGVMFLAFYLWVLSGVGILSLIARRTELFPGDLVITRALQKRHNPAVRGFMQAVSEPGFREMSVPITVGATGLLWALRFRLEAIFLLLTTSSNILNYIVKRMIKRPRPNQDLVSVVRVINEPSFPSGHVMHYTNFYGMLIYVLATNWPSGRLRNTLMGVCGALIALVGPSRVYLGAHWPSDAAAGYLYGGLWYGGIMAIYLRVKAWLNPPVGSPPAIFKPLAHPTKGRGGARTR